MSKIVAIYALLLRKTFGPKFSGRVNLLVEKSHVWAFLSISFSINFVFLKICSTDDEPLKNLHITPIEKFPTCLAVGFWLGGSHI